MEAIPFLFFVICLEAFAMADEYGRDADSTTGALRRPNACPEVSSAAEVVLSYACKWGGNLLGNCHLDDRDLGLLTVAMLERHVHCNAGTSAYNVSASVQITGKQTGNNVMCAPHVDRSCCDWGSACIHCNHVPCMHVGRNACASLRGHQRQ